MHLNSDVLPGFWALSCTWKWWDYSTNVYVPLCYMYFSSTAISYWDFDITSLLLPFSCYPPPPLLSQGCRRGGLFCFLLKKAFGVRGHWPSYGALCCLLVLSSVHRKWSCIWKNFRLWKLGDQQRPPPGENDNRTKPDKSTKFMGIYICWSNLHQK